METVYGIAVKWRENKRKT